MQFVSAWGTIIVDALGGDRPPSCNRFQFLFTTYLAWWTMKFDRLTTVCPLLSAIVLAGCAGPNEDSKKNSDATTVAHEKSTNHANQAWKNWADELNQMATILDLNDEEKAKLKTSFKEQAKIVGEFWNETGKQLNELERKIKSAVKEKSLTNMRELIAAAKPMRERFQKLLEERERALLDALSPARREQWMGYRLVERFWKLTKSMTFSDEQKSKIKQLAVQAAKSVAGKPNPTAAGFLDLEKMIEEQVLDPNQQKAYESIKSKNKLRSLFK